MLAGLTGHYKLDFLNKAIEIAKSAAGSGTPGGTNVDNLTNMIKETYDMMVKIAEEK